MVRTGSSQIGRAYHLASGIYGGRTAEPASQGAKIRHCASLEKECPAGRIPGDERYTDDGTIVVQCPAWYWRTHSAETSAERPNFNDVVLNSHCSAGYESEHQNPEKFTEKYGHHCQSLSCVS